MKTSQAFLASFVVAILLAACRGGERPYADELAAFRAEKDEYMRSDESPVAAASRATFPPLAYFPVDESYRVPAGLTVARGNEVIELQTSRGTRDRMRRIGTLEFTLKGQRLTLTAFAPAADTTLRRLFVPFGDLTSGTETYQGGRYIDLDRTRTGVYDLDFNRAYHPFCVYNAEYICPIPPRENRLAVPVRAGEKLAAR